MGSQVLKKWIKWLIFNLSVINLSLISAYHQTLFLMRPWGWAMSGHPRWHSAQYLAAFCPSLKSHALPHLNQPEDYKKVWLFPLSCTELIHHSLHSGQKKVTNSRLAHSSKGMMWGLHTFKATWCEDFIHSSLPTPKISLHVSSLLFFHCSFLWERNIWARPNSLWPYLVPPSPHDFLRPPSHRRSPAPSSSGTLSFCVLKPSHSHSRPSTKLPSNVLLPFASLLLFFKISLSP